VSGSRKACFYTPAESLRFPETPCENEAERRSAGPGIRKVRCERLHRNGRERKREKRERERERERERGRGRERAERLDRVNGAGTPIQH